MLQQQQMPDLDDLLEAARRSLETDPGRSLQASTRAVLMYPQSAEAWFLSAAAKLDLNRPEEAAKELARAVDLEPRIALHHAGLAGALIQLAKPAEAIDACNRALRIDPECELARLTAGNAFRAMGKWDEAIQMLEPAIARPEADPDFRNALALAYCGRGFAAWPTQDDVQYATSRDQVEEARAYLDRATALSPPDPAVGTAIAEARKAVAFQLERSFTGKYLYLVLPSLMTFGGLMAMANGEAAAGLGLAALFGGSVALYIVGNRPRGYVRNRRLKQGKLGRNGVMEYASQTGSSTGEWMFQVFVGAVFVAAFLPLLAAWNWFQNRD